MGGHKSEIIHIKEEVLTEYGHNGVISVSSNEIFFWDLFYGYSYLNITIPSSFFISNKYSNLVYIDE